VRSRICEQPGESAGAGLATLSEVPEKRVVYVIQSEVADRTYIGLTSDFERRLAAHNAGQNVSTARFKPWRALTVIAFHSEESAAAFEAYLKSGSGRAFVRTHFR
jgi:putative endonuclease